MKLPHFLTFLFFLFLEISSSFAGPMKPLGPLNIEGTIIKISWHPEEFRKGIPGMSGSAGQDRTIPAHYRLSLSGTWENREEGSPPSTHKGDIDIRINHPLNDSFLMKNISVRINGYRENGDEGGIRSSFEKIEILGTKERPEIINLFIDEGSVKLLVDFKQTFDWEKITFVSKKTFPLRGGARMPHEIKFGLHEEGFFNWRQYDYIEGGKYEAIDQFTVEAEILRRKKFTGVFDPNTNLLEFDGLEYEPFMVMPKASIEASKDLKIWSKVSLNKKLPSEYKRPSLVELEIKFELESNNFIRVTIEED